MFVVAALTQSAQTERTYPPRVPAELQVPAGHKAYLEGHAVRDR